MFECNDPQLVSLVSNTQSNRSPPNAQRDLEEGKTILAASNVKVARLSMDLLPSDRPTVDLEGGRSR